MDQKKLRLGWFSFSCCEDSTILFTEILNDHYREWKRLIEFKHFLPLQKKEDLSEMDVSFIEGAVADGKQEEKVRKIRELSKKVICIGACACVGLPSAQRNNFDEETKKEIEFILTRFNYNPSVKKISDVIPIDGQVPGCPMNEEMFLKTLNEVLVEFGIK